MDNNNTQDNNKMQKGGQTLLVWAVAALITFMVITFMRDALTRNSTVEYTYSEFLDRWFPDRDRAHHGRKDGQSHGYLLLYSAGFWRLYPGGPAQ